jgi:uncharacterized protein
VGGLVPFFMRVHTPGGTAGRGCRTSARPTCALTPGTARAGPGIWFLTLGAAHLGAVAVARASYWLPYFWSSMRLLQHGPEITCSCQRRLPGLRTATSQVRVRVGAP